MATDKSQLSDNQRRFICRVAFLLLCLLPTSAVIYCVLHQPGPSEWEQTVLAQLGVKVEIDSVETPTPNTAIFRGVKICDSESNPLPELDGRTIEELLIVFGNNSNQIVVKESVTIQSSSLRNVIQQCSSRLGDALSERCNWQIGLSKILLVDADSSDFVLESAKIFLKKNQLSASSEPDAIQAVLQATVPGQNQREQIEISVGRVANQNVVEIDTRNAFLPCHLISHYVPDAKFVGNSCRFNGNLKFSFYDDHWDKMHCNVVGRMENVHLDRLTGVPARRFTGLCNFPTFELQVEDGRIVVAKVHAVSDGAISVDRNLINDALDLDVQTSLVLKDQQMVSFAQLHVGLFLHNGELILSGTKGEIRQDGQIVEVDGAIAFDREGDALAVCNSSLSIPIQQMAMLLTGEKSLGNQSVALMDRFKILTPRTAQNDDAIPPYRR